MPIINIQNVIEVCFCIHLLGVESVLEVTENLRCSSESTAITLCEAVVRTLHMPTSGQEVIYETSILFLNYCIFERFIEYRSFNKNVHVFFPTLCYLK